ncbi:MAG: glucoamylase family protein, partial [Bryobacteraceae bacterium]
MLVLLKRVAGRAERLSKESAAAEETPELPAVINSIRHVGEATWKDLFEDVSIVDRILRRDPAGAYRRMDYDSRDLYRTVIANLARYSTSSETAVAEAAIALAEDAVSRRAGDPAVHLRRSHVGYYLIDKGEPVLKHKIGYRPSLFRRVRELILRNPNGFYLVGVELTTFLIVVSLLSGLDVLTPIVVGALMLLIPATQAAVDFMNNLTSFLVQPRRLAKLDFSEGIPADCTAMVAVPTLLLNESQVRQLVEDLEIRFLANRDPNLYFALLTDSPDSPQQTDEKDELVSVATGFIEELNQRYGSGGTGPFYLFHRHRVFNPSENAWMGWERKRGKLLDLNKLLRNDFDSFPVKVGDLSVLPRIKYVITLDSDTQLPRDIAHRMVGAIAHPLNRAVIHPVTNTVVDGYGILQPRVGVSIQSAVRSRLAAIYSGQTGFDIYTRAISDVYQDLYGEGSFTGKGIYDVDALRTTLDHTFPANALLSHDLIEGAYARAGLVSDIEVIDDYPSHFSAYSRRKHRWIRGDWQITRWLFPRVPDFFGRQVTNPTSLVSRWKILDNLRRSVIEPGTFLLFLAGWFYLPGGPLYWTIATLVLLLIPVYSQLLFTVLRINEMKNLVLSLKEAASAFVKGHVSVILQVVFLPHQALMTLDAIVRTIIRQTITHSRLLQWETAAQAETESRKRTPVDLYLDLAPWVAVLIGFLLAFLRPQSLPVAAPILLLWFSAKVITAWLNRPPRREKRKLTSSDEIFLRDSALRTWRYFREFSTAETNWLVPDNVQESPWVLANRISPTNLGLLLNAKQSALEFGYLTLPEFARETSQTLQTVARLSRLNGHFVNWYDTRTLAPLEPQFISTVDSGNLAGSLWTLKQGCLAMERKPLFHSGLWEGIRDHVRLLAQLAPEETAPLERRVHALKTDEVAWIHALEDMDTDTERIRSMLETDAAEAHWWASELVARLRGVKALVERFTPWLLPQYQDILKQSDERALKGAGALT